MTYISTQNGSDSLRRVVPRPILGAEIVRGIEVRASIHDRMYANAAKEDFPSFRADRLISTYCHGQYISYSLYGDPNSKKPDIERLIDLDEVWVLCMRDIKANQWRLFGRFFDKNCYAGLILARRGELVRNGYKEKAQKAIDEWDRLFGVKQPVRGDNISYYMSGVLRDVDDGQP